MSTCDLKDQLDQINGRLIRKDTTKVDNLECRYSSIDSNRSASFSQVKLWNNDHVRTMVSILGHYSSKRVIELDTSLDKSLQDIHEILIKDKTHEETNVHII